jgi:cyclophilin family peptidyl-prolyl cis-trans isomerase
MGGAKETINLEIHQELRHVDGAISMARSQNPNSASSQFFICDGAQAFLDDNYATFGRTVEGMDVVRAIAAVATGANDKPVENVTMVKVTIE